MPTWFILCISSVVALALAELCQQYVLNRNNPLAPRASSVLGYIFQSLLVLPFVLAFHYHDFFSVFSAETLPRLLAVTIIGSFATVLYLKSFKVQNISLSSIFGSLSVVVSTSLGIYFFGESTSFMKFFGIALILIAIISLNYKNAILEKNHFYGLIAGILFGVCYTLDKGIVETIEPIVYVFWNFALIGFFCFLINPKQVYTSIVKQNLSAIGIVFISSMGYLLYNFLTFTAYRAGGEVGKVDSINNSQVFLIILFEYFILRHKTSTFRKLVTALMAFAGILILGLYS
jgi:drug/metabolite transporter (DMT)-like permease